MSPDVPTPRRRVLFIEQEIPHYRAGVLDAIARGIDADFEFFSGIPPQRQAFLEKGEADLSYPVTPLRLHWFLRERLVFQNYWPALRRQRSAGPCAVILRHNPRSLLLLPFMRRCHRLGLPVLIWGQGFSRKRPFRPHRHPLDRLNLAIVRAARAYVAYSDEIRDQLSRHVNPAEIFTASNTLNLTHLVPVRQRLENEGKTRIRERLGLPARHYLLFIGRLQARKRVDLFISALARLQKQHGVDVGGIIIGQGPEEPQLRAQGVAEGVRHLHFAGAPNFVHAADWMMASDLLVIPGWLGLAVNHAFFFGLPVIGQRWDESLRQHGPEAAYIRHGENGLLAEAHQPESLVESVKAALQQHPALSRSAREYFDTHLDINRMVAGFRAAIDFALPPPITADAPVGTR